MRPSDEKIIFGSTRKFRKDTGWETHLSRSSKPYLPCWNIGIDSYSFLYKPSSNAAK